MFIVHLKDGRAIHEDEVINGVTHDWKKIKEISNGLKDVTAVQVKKGQTYYTLSVKGENVDLIQLKANILDFTAGTDTLVERVLGFIIKNEKNDPLYAVKMRIGEKTGGVKLSLEKMTDKGWVSL
jgi:hypothetical protein